MTARPARLRFWSQPSERHAVPLGALRRSPAESKPNPKMPPMNASALVLLTALLGASFAPAQDPAQEKTPAKKKAMNPVTAFFQGEGERLEKELDGSWMLFGYADPGLPPFDDAVSGFATFHDGFLQWVLAINSAERHLLWLKEFLILETGAYRYRLDEGSNLQLASVMSFTNETDDGSMLRQPSGQAFEYGVRLEDGVLELRNPQGILFSLRKITAGEFPESAIQKIEGQRSNDEMRQGLGDEPPR